MLTALRSTRGCQRQSLPAFRLTRLWPALLILLLFPALGLALEPLLPQEQAFRPKVMAADVDMLHLHWDIADGYYLYRDKFQFQSLTPGIRLGQILYPAGGEYIDDPAFGKMLIYHGQIDITIPYVRDQDGAAAVDTLTLKTVSQGCADRGVCYAPHTRDFSIPLAADKPVTGASRPDSNNGLLDRINSFGQSLGQRLGLASRSDTRQMPFLPADQAYILSVDVIDGQTLKLRWDIAEGYYLYREKIRAAVISPPEVRLGAPQSAPGEVKQDEYFGRMEVYHQHAEATLTVSRDNGRDSLPLRLDIAYQGCAEAGFCYPPINKQIDLTLPPLDAATGRSNASGSPSDTATEALSEQDRIAQLLGSDRAILTALGLFGIGLLLAFTPCVFPMVPILSSIIIGQGSSVTTRRAFLLSLVYVLAMALTYTVAGVVAGLFGNNLQAAFQSPWVIVPFSLIFVALALAMFGFYELQMPQHWQTRLNDISNRQRRGNYVGVAIMGALSALIVGPCVAAPLAGILIYIGLSGNAVMGGFSLFMMSLGMGLPLLVIGTSAGKLMPRIGPWMSAIKAVFGVLLLGLAIWMLERILPGPVTLLLWAALLIGSAVNMGALSRLEPDANHWQKLWKVSGLVLLIYGAVLIIGASSGSNDLFQPLKGVQSSTRQPEAHSTAFKPVKGVDGLRAELLAASRRGQAVMLDFYADWCIECKRLAKATFSDPDVIQGLSGLQLLQADVTANDAEDQALLKEFGLFGPPAILFFDPRGIEIKHRRLIGFLDNHDFLRHIQATYPSR